MHFYRKLNGSSRSSNYGYIPNRYIFNLLHFKSKHGTSNPKFKSNFIGNECKKRINWDVFRVYCLLWPRKPPSTSSKLNLKMYKRLLLNLPPQLSFHGISRRTLDKADGKIHWRQSRQTGNKRLSYLWWGVCVCVEESL